MKILLVHNPGSGSAERADRAALERLIRGAGHEPDYCSCRDEDWRSAVRQPYDVVAVAGGDGTVTRVAKAMTGSRTPIGVLPLGTANNVAMTLGAAGVPMEELVAHWQNASRLRCDVGLVKAPWGSARFIEGIGAGLFAWTMPHADVSPTIASLDRTDAKVVYALQMLKDRVLHCPARTMRVSLDGRDLSGEYLLFEAMNLRYVGPNLFLAPKADSGDGCLDIVRVTEADRERFHAYLSSWQHGWLRPPELPCDQGRSLVIEWSDYELHLDDVLWPDPQSTTSHGRVEVLMNGESVEFLAPPAQPAPAA